MDILINNQFAIQSQINVAITNFKKTGKTRWTVGYLTSKLEALNAYWKDFDGNHREILSKQGDNDDKDEEEYFKDDLYSEIEDKVFEYRGIMQQHIIDCSQASTVNLNVQNNGATVNASNGQGNAGTSDIRLPKIQIPVFSGDYNAWRSFYDLFVFSVHNNNKLSRVQKLHYLKTSLSGEAGQLVQHLQLCNENYDSAWGLLVQRYENKKVLVHTQLKTLTSQATMSYETSFGVKRLLDVTTESLHALKALGIGTDGWDDIIVFLTVQKLSPQTRMLWEESCSKSIELPTFKQLQTFLEARFRTLEVVNAEVHQSKGAGYNNHGRNFSSSKPTNTKALHSASSENCPACSSNHFIMKCPRFNGMTPIERMKTILQSSSCFNCLSRNHSVNRCNSKATCTTCRRKHHSLLHGGWDNVETGSSNDTVVAHATNDNNLSQKRTTPNPFSGTSQPLENISAKNNVASHFAGRVRSQVLLATALIRAQTKSGSEIHLRALLDQGSETSFITENAAQSLQLNRSNVSGTITGIGAGVSVKSKHLVSLVFGPRQGGKMNLSTNAMVLPNITGCIPSKTTHISDWGHINNLMLADPGFTNPGNIDVLLSADVYSQIICEGLKRGSPGSPIAQNTLLGWVIFGRVTEIDHAYSVSTKTSSFVTLTDGDEQLQRFWEIENVSNFRSPSVEESECERLFQITHSRSADGRYIVRLPFRENNDEVLNLGRSRAIAVANMLQLEKRFTRDAELKRKYVECIEEYGSLGHMEPTTSKEQAIHNSYSSCYLSHHAVVKETSSTTKLRVVFDASRKTSSGVSLNEALMVGPTIQQDLWSIVIRWRRHQVALTADIEKMYRQVKVENSDSEYQRIVWRKSSLEPMVDYRLGTLTFGTGIAPFLAVRAMQQLAIDERHRWPLASKVTLRDFYVDDIMTGSDTIEEAIILHQQLVRLLDAGGLKLRKWASNRDEILEGIQDADREVNFPLDIKLDEGIKTLGIRWLPSADIFNFSVNLDPWIGKSTKRQFLSDVSRIFDPLGWTAPTMIIPKIMFQGLWKAKIKWDDQLPNEILEDWKTFRDNLKLLESIQIPRWIAVHNGNTLLELHGFCDSSVKAYSSVVYVRVMDSEGRIHVNLVTAKTRVAPIKQVSLPRLELCGAVLLANLLERVKSALDFVNVPIFAWTDSTIVLCWLNGNADRWKTFVANRVTEISQLVGKENWYHIRSQDNPADCATRGVRPEDLKAHQLWWNGPPWLDQPRDQWPHAVTSKTLETTIELKKGIKITALTSSPVNSILQNLLNNYSDLNKSLRILSYVMRFAKNTRTAIRKRLTGVSVDEIRCAHNEIVRDVQKMEFLGDFEQLSVQGSLNTKSQLINLNPFIDKENILRARGRLGLSNLTFNEINPIIIPAKSRLAYLLISAAHNTTLHGGVQLMMSILRRKYWILGAKNSVRRYIHSCVKCHRYKTQGLTQIMGDLPTPRVTITRPFTHCGVDYAGPIDIRTSKGRGHKSFKGYISIFVCLCTKAIHIELVSDLSTQGFLAALKRFIGRRGLCSDMYSDNGTNFVGADGKLRKIFSEYNKGWRSSISNAVVEQGIAWHFIPPAAPHFGGLWEAGVKSIKHHLKRVIGTSTLTFEELATVLIQIEACLNSRPLCPITSDADDLDPLTPGHFIMGTAPLTLPESSLLDLNIHSLNRWQLLERKFQEFWNAWSSEYLSRLQQRPKWTKKKMNIDIGALVLLKDEKITPTRWPLARIIATTPGKDGVVRVVTVKTQNGTYVRPITKICPLPDMNNDGST